MRIQQQELEHPTQASRLRLNLYRYEPPREESVAGLMPHQPGFLVTEERIGTSTVVSSLGFLAEEHQALHVLQERREELARQGWRKASASEPEEPAAARAYGGDPPRVSVPGDPTPRPPKPV